MDQASATFTSILGSHFNQAAPHVPFSIINDIRQRFATKQVLPIKELPLDEYLAATRSESLEVVRRKWSGGLAYARWDSIPGGSDQACVLTNVESGHIEVLWQDTLFDVFKATWKREYSEKESLYVLVFDGTTDSKGRDFFQEVSSWDDRRKVDGMWVFNLGRWEKDKALSAAIRDVSWDDLVLDAKEVDRLRKDVAAFFDSESMYKSLGVPWKRGLLLVGPPGNGKSHAIKIIVKESSFPCLYVKSTKSEVGGIYGRHETSEYCIMTIFNMARKSAPCVLVFEDLDSLLGEETRTFFLNEVDGFTNNDGILILASSNHPERIDEAIINRPSRFDVKYKFDIPSPALRRQYALKWLTKISKFGSPHPIINLPDHALLADRIAQATDGFSFAFLKELFLSFLLSMAHSTDAESTSEPLLFAEIEQLKKQIEKQQTQSDKAKPRIRGFSRAIRFFR